MAKIHIYQPHNPPQRWDRHIPTHTDRYRKYTAAYTTQGDTARRSTYYAHVHARISRCTGTRVYGRDWRCAWGSCSEVRVISPATLTLQVRCRMIATRKRKKNGEKGAVECTCTPRRNSPASHLILRVGPQEVAHGAFVRHFLKPNKKKDRQKERTNGKDSDISSSGSTFR